MPATVVFDCEYLAVDGSQARFWSGPQDPDPVVIQIGAVRIELEGDFAISGVLQELILPFDRHGKRYQLDPYISRLTGIENCALDERGLPLSQVLEKLRAFAQGCRLWSWGKDEFLLLALSCFVQSIEPSIPARRFGNLKSILMKSGMPPVELPRIQSGQLASHYGVAPTSLRAHDGLDDALSLAHVARHLLSVGALAPSDLM